MVTLHGKKSKKTKIPKTWNNSKEKLGLIRIPGKETGGNIRRTDLKILLLFSCPVLCNPMNCSMPGYPIPHHHPKFAQVHVHCIGDAIQPSHSLRPSSPSALSLSQHQGHFQRVNSLHEVAKVLEFQLQHLVVSNSLQPHEPQHARPLCPSLTPGVYPNSCPLRWWCHQLSHPLPSPFPPAFNLSQHWLTKQYK